MYAFFLFLALFCFLQGVRRKRQLISFAVAVICFSLSILSKETAIAAFILFPGIILVEAIKKQSISSTLSKRLALVTSGIIILLTAGYILLRLTVLNFQNTLNYYSTANVYTSSLAVRLFTFAKVIWIYFGLLIFPYPLHMERTTTLILSFLSPFVIATIALIGVISIFVVWEIKTKKTAYALFGFLLCIATLTPVSGIIPINDLLYEHWLYLPLVGFFIICFRAFELLCPPVFLKGWGRSVLFVAGIAVAGIFVILTIRQNNIWSDPIVFYTYTLQFTESARLQNNLGMSYVAVGDNKDAIDHYKKALAIGPSYPQIYNDLGWAYLQEKQYALAEKNLQIALRLAPNFYVTKSNLLQLYLVTKQFQKAKELAGKDAQMLQIIKSVQSGQQ